MLYVGVAGVGLAYGGLWALSPTLVYELYGAKNWGVNNSFIGLGPATSSYLFSTLMAGSLYMANINNGTKQCYGQQCYRASFLISAGISVVGVITCSMLVFLTRTFYGKKASDARYSMQYH